MAICVVWLPLTCHADFADDVEVGIGLLGHLGGNFLDQPNDLGAAEGSDEILLVYPGFGGTAGGGGLYLDVRFRGFLGLELDLLYSSDRGSGFVDYVRVDIGQTAWHIPVLFKGTYPGEFLRPGFVIGLEVVVPARLEVATEPVLPAEATRIGGRAGSYTMFITGLSLEIALPFDHVDLRIPLALRFGLNPSTPAAARDRAEYELGGPDGLEVQAVVFSSEWQYQIHTTAGLAVHF